MAGLDMQAMGKYLALGAGAVAAPIVVAMIPGVSGILGNQILTTGWSGITVGGVLLAAVGVGVVDQLMGK